MMVLTTVGGFLANGQSPATSADSLATQAAIDSLPPIEKMPAVVTFVNADYPDSIIRQGIQGDVVMDVIVSDSGRVDSVAVVKGLHPVLDSAAVAAMRKFVLTPAMAGGVGVPVLWQYAYHFTFEALVDSIAPVANFGGILLERGTRAPVVSAMVVVTFIDTVGDSLLTVPFRTYIKKIATFGNQHIEENSLVTTTDSLGRFQFYSLPACGISVRFPIPGYETIIDTILIKRDTAQSITYRLQRLSYSDYEIVVYGKTKEKEVAHHALTINEVKRIPGLGGDAVKVVQALPGVARPGILGAAVVVRGAPTWDSRFYLDGVAIPQLYHFGGIKSTYNSDALESVNLYPGGFGTRYGGGIAGVIEIEGRKPKIDRFHGYLDANGYDASFLVEGPVTDKVSVLASARRSYIGDILRFALEYIDFPVSIAPYYWDYILRTNYAISKDNNAFLNIFGSQDALELILPQSQGGSKAIDAATNTISQKTMFHMACMGWNWNITPAFTNEVRLSATYQKSETSIMGFAKWQTTMGDYYLRDQLTLRQNEQIKWNAGVDIELMPTDFSMKIPDASYTIQSEDTTGWLFGVVGVYLNTEWKPLPALTIIPGLRFDYYPELNYTGTVIPELWHYTQFDNHHGFAGDPALRISARYELAKGHTLKTAIGTYDQTPKPMGQTIDATFGNPALGTSKAAHYVGGYEWQITDLISSDIQVYHNEQWNIPRQPTTAENAAGFQGNYTVPRYFDDGLRRMTGFELLLRHDQGKSFFGWIAYSLSHSEEWNFSAGKYVVFGQDQTHNLQFIGSWKLPRDWDIGTRIRYVTGNPTTPIIGSKATNASLSQYTPLYGEPRSTRMDPFFQVDLRVDKRIVFDQWIFSFYLDIQNLSYFVYQSPEFKIPNYDYTQFTPVGGIFYPSIGLKAEF